MSLERLEALEVKIRELETRLEKIETKKCVFCKNVYCDSIETNPYRISDEVARLYYEVKENKIIPRNLKQSECIHDDWLINELISNFIGSAIHLTCCYEPKEIIKILSDFDTLNRVFLYWIDWSVSHKSNLNLKDQYELALECVKFVGKERIQNIDLSKLPLMQVNPVCPVASYERVIEKVKMLTIE